MKRRIFESRAPKAINLGWDHGRYGDYWSFIHFLTGLFLGTLGLFLGLSLFSAFLINLILACLYESFEAIIGISEDIQNVATDILLVSVGAPFAFFVFPLSGFSRTDLILALCVVLVLDLLLLRRGWKVYLKNALKKRRKST